KHLSDRQFSFNCAVNGVSHHSVIQVNLAVTASRLEGEAAAALAQAAHLQDLRRGKLIEISDEAMAWINAFHGGGRSPPEGRHDSFQLATQLAISTIGRD